MSEAARRSSVATSNFGALHLSDDDDDDQDLDDFGTVSYAQLPDVGSPSPDQDSDWDNESSADDDDDDRPTKPLPSTPSLSTTPSLSRTKSVRSGARTQGTVVKTKRAPCCFLCAKPHPIPEPLRHGAFLCGVRGANPLRLATFHFVQSRGFEALVILVIFGNCAILAYEDPTLSDDERPAWNYFTDISFASFFTFEMLLKWFAFGLFRHHGSYFRSGWNRLDFVIVVLSWLNFVPNIGNFSALRTLRVLRPLRSLNAVKGLKTLVVALITSMQSLWPVIVLGFIVFSIFAIVGSQLYSGDLANVCFPVYGPSWNMVGTDVFNPSIIPPNLPIDNYTDPAAPSSVSFSPRCTNSSGVYAGALGSLCQPGFICLSQNDPGFNIASFDNSALALLIVFEVMTFESWPQIFRVVLQTTGEPSAIYFFFLVLVASYFVPNLAVAIINDRYHDAIARQTAEDERLELLKDARDAQQAKLEAASAALQLNQSSSRVNFSGVFIADSTVNDLDPAEMAEDAAAAPPQSIPCFLKFRNLLHRMSLGYELPEYTMAAAELEIAASEASPMSIAGSYNYASSFTRSRFSTGSESDARTRITVFSGFIILCILLNTALLAVQHHNQPAWLDNITDVANKGFVGIFGVEFLINLTAVGFKRFFKSGFYVLDFIVVLSSVLEMLLNNSSFFTVLRALRLLRVLKLVRNAPALHEVVTVMLEAVMDSIYLALVLFLVMLVFCLAGMQFFGGSMRRAEAFTPTPSQPAVVVRAHFDDFLSSVYTVFQIISTDNWVDTMWVAMATSGYPACIYFIVLIIVGYFVVANLFLSILIQSFSRYVVRKAEMDNRVLQDGIESTYSSNQGAPQTIVLGTIEDQKRRARMEKHESLNPLMSELAAFFENVPATALALAMSSQADSVERQIKAMPVTTEQCRRCGTFKQAVLVAPPFRPKLSVNEFHDTHCWKSEIRKEKEDAAMKMLALTMEHMKNDTLLTDDMREVVIARAQSRGFFKTLKPRDLRSWTDIRDEINEEIAVLRLCVGEEQLGRAHVSYVYEGLTLRHPTNGSSSFFILGPDNAFRAWLTHVTRHGAYNFFVLLLVIASCLLIIGDSPGTSFGSTVTAYFPTIDLALNCAFAFDIVIRMISLGLFMHPGSYLRDGWNWLDLISTVLSFTSVFSPARSLRLFRFIRPLRLIKRYRGLRLIASTIISSISGIFNVMLLMMICYVIFGILAVQLFGGKLYSCTDPSITTVDACVGTFPRAVTQFDPAKGFLVTQYVNSTRSWRNSDRNFDNIIWSVLTLTQVSAGDDWTDVLYASIDAKSDTEAPVRDYQPLAGLFFVFFYLISNYFFLNLFVGVVIVNFSLEKNKTDGVAFLTPEQRDWVDSQRAILKVRPDPLLLLPGAGGIRKRLDAMIRSSAFDIVIAVTISLNILVIGMEFNNQPDTYSTVLNYANIAFAGLFILEMLLKLIAYRLRYFLPPWNRFDCFLALLGALTVAFQFSAQDSLNVLPFNLAILRVLRFVRILRVLRLFKRAKRVRVLVETLWYSLPSIANISLLLLIVFIVFSVIGVQIFSGVRPGGRFLDDQYFNFDTIYSTLQLLFIFMTNQKWSASMYDMMESAPYCQSDGSDCGTPYAPLYFVTFIVMVSFVVTNLFLAIILDNFAVTIKMDDSRVTLTDLHRFSSVWALFDPDATLMIPTAMLPKLLAELQPPLGLTRRGGRLDMLRRLREFKIIDHAGSVHYAEVLVPLAREVTSQTAGSLYGFELHDIGFSNLDELPTVMYEHRPSQVAHAMAATIVAASFRRHLAQRRVQELWKEKEAQRRAQSNARPRRSSLRWDITDY